MQPDYDMAEVLELTTLKQFKALGDLFRQKILALLLERSATTTWLAEALGSPVSTVAHHLQVLTEAGLTKVVQTRRVRALTEKYYGRTARTYIGISHKYVGEYTSSFQDNLEVHQTSEFSRNRKHFVTSSFSRLSASQLKAFIERIDLLAQEFEDQSVTEEQMYHFVSTITQIDTFPLS